ncbi:MAG: YceD family protein [Bacteroidia bacterium]
MKQLKEYIINFGNLKLGKHLFEFTADDDFFSLFEYSLAKKGHVEVALVLEKQRDSLLILNFTLKGKITLECDRCLDEFDYPIQSEHRLLVKLEGKQEESDNDELIFLSHDTYMLDISPYIYEFINLSLPLKRVCDEGGKTCNPNMINYLDHVNEQENDDTEIDPRWEGLKRINKDNN